MIRHVLIAVIVFAPLSTAAHSAVECKAEAPATRTGYWSWRNIDGKQCWYQGRPGMDKANLRWPPPAPPPAAIHSDSDQALVESHWPNLEE
jgi:hypothetical protein